MQDRPRRRLAFAHAVLAVALWIAVPPAVWSDPITKDQLKTGMPLAETIQTLGQPMKMEWVNYKGQSVLFLFYEGTACTFCIENITGQDLLVMDDGRTAYPLGFIVDALAGWGRKYYEGMKFPKE